MLRQENRTGAMESPIKTGWQPERRASFAAHELGAQLACIKFAAARPTRAGRLAHRSRPVPLSLKPRASLPEPILPAHSPSINRRTVDEDQLARLGPNRSAVPGGKGKQASADSLPVDPALKPSPSEGGCRRGRTVSPSSSRGGAAEMTTGGERRLSCISGTFAVAGSPTTLSCDQIEELVQKHLTWVSRTYPWGEAFQVLVVPVRAPTTTAANPLLHAASGTAPGTARHAKDEGGGALVDVNILYPEQAGHPRGNVRLVKKTSVQLLQAADGAPPAPDDSDAQAVAAPGVSPGYKLPVPENPFNSFMGHHRPKGVPYQALSSPSTPGSIRRGSLMENCNHSISRYVARQLPVLFAVLVQTRVPIDKQGFDIVLPMPYPLAWPDTVRFLQTGLGQLLSEQVKGNIEYLGGAITPLR